MAHTTWLQNHAEIYDVSTDIKDMVKEKGNTCVSIIVPTHRLGQDRQGDKTEIQQAIFAAKQAVQYEHGDFLQSIDKLFGQIDFSRNKEGVGMFVSPRINKLVKFPFPVTKKIVINKFFHLHDLLYIENYRIVYYVLDISKKEIHLFGGVLDHLEEIRDDYFPKTINEEYEYNKPSRSSSDAGYAHVKGFEKDKSILQQIRIKKIFQQADKALGKYTLSKDTPFLLCGPEKAISIFRSVTRHAQNILTSIHDNYKGAELHDLEVSAWLRVRSFLDDQKLKIIGTIKERIGEASAAYGIEDVWNAAKQGRGLTLLVEKDYGKPAFLAQDNRLYLRHPQETHVKFPDVVNEIINTVIEKNGEVVIVEKNALKEYERIALILRY